MPASAAARLASVFLATAYVVWSPSARRSALSCATVSPRYSVSTVAVEDRKCSVSSATAVALSVRTGLSAMSLLSLRQAGTPGLTTRNAPAQGARGGGADKRRALIRPTCAGRLPEQDLRPTTEVAVTSGLWWNSVISIRVRTRPAKSTAAVVTATPAVRATARLDQAPRATAATADNR